MSSAQVAASGAVLAARMAHLAQALADPEQDQATVAAAGLSMMCGLIPQAECAALVIADPHAPARVLASTSQLASLAAQLQHREAQGPSVEALQGQPLVHAEDLGSSDARQRWPKLGSALADAGIRSAVSCCVAPDDQHRAEVSLFAGSPGAFNRLALERIPPLAAALNVLVVALLFRERATQLAHAVESNRQIGIAVGVIMTRRLCTAEQAFSALRRASERRHLKLREVAEQVIATGELDDGDARPSGHT